MVNRALPVTVQKAFYLGRPIQHEDHHDDVEPRAFMAGVFHRTHRRPIPTEISAEPVLAHLDAGRWIGHCPLGCRGAELVSEADPIFLCCSCGSGDQWWPVAFPGNRTAIDAEVSKRVDILAWGWTPGETLRDLQNETVRLAAQ